MKSKNYYQANKEKLQGRLPGKYYRNLSEDDKIKKRNYVNIRNKIMSEKTEKGKKNIWEKREHFLNHLNNRVEELENFSLNK